MVQEPYILKLTVTNTQRGDINKHLDKTSNPLSDPPIEISSCEIASMSF